MAEPHPHSADAAAAEASPRARLPEPVRSLLRRVAAVLTAGTVGAVAWLIVVQEGGKRGYTALDINHALGEVWKGPMRNTSVREEDALGVVGDPVAPIGLRVAVVSGIVLALAYALLSPLLPLRRLYARALPLALLVFLLTALVYAPLVESRGVARAGPFGLDAGAGTPLVFAAGALVFGVVVARVHDLMVRARWWEPTAEDIAAASLAAVVTAAEKRGVSSLELAEQGAEESRKGPGA